MRLREPGSARAVLPHPASHLLKSAVLRTDDVRCLANLAADDASTRPVYRPKPEVPGNDR
jgi:hypothetical protein